MQVRRRLKLQVGEYDWQSSMGCARLFIFGMLVIIFIGIYGATHFDGVSPRDLADEYRKTIWFLHYMPEAVLIVIAAVFNWHTFRYMIAPISAIISILIAGAMYVQDIYALPNFKAALEYVLSSMFGLSYPTLVIDKGEKQVKKGEVNLIDKIGGPGFVMIEPGNAAMFRKLRGPSSAKVSETYFLEPFEKLASAINLDEQHGMKEFMPAMTRDGIKVVVKDIHYRYRLKLEEKDGEPVRRSLENPYPFSEKSIHDMNLNLIVEKTGLESWRGAIDRAVTGTISDYVNAQPIDKLTAPRTNEAQPRLEINSKLFEAAMKSNLARLGAELLWVDVGHIEIEDESVDELRTNLWSADLAGDAAEVRAYGDAIRQAYQELGRAEAQADLIMSIAGALSEANLGDNPKDNIRKILLARTAQLLNAMNETGKGAEQAKE
jgi:hypothetical protein